MAEKKIEKKKILLYHWLAMQIAANGRAVPTQISPEWSDPDKAKAWFRQMRKDGNLGPCTYRMAAWASKPIVIE